MLKYFKLIIFFAGFFSSAVLAQSAILDSLIHQALEVSPRLKMLESKHQASESRVNQNSNLPDPILTLGLANLPTNSFSFTQEPMTGKIVGLSQAIPFPGKLGSVADIAEKDAEIVTKEISDAENEIKKNISQNYWELVFVRKSIEVAKESKSLLENIAEVVRSNYTVSNASQQNILKVELELTNITDKN